MFALTGNTDTADATATILLITMIGIVRQALLIALFAHVTAIGTTTRCIALIKNVPFYSRP